MRLAGVSTIDQANEVLRDFLPRFNPVRCSSNQPGSAYRQLPPSTCLDAVLCFKYIRTVANDNTVRFEGTPARRPQGQLRSRQRTCPGEARRQHRRRLPGQDPGSSARTGRPCPAQGTERPPTQRPFALRLGSRRLQWHSPRPADAERRNGAKAQQGDTPRPQATKRPGPTRPTPDHPWRSATDIITEQSH